MIGIAIDPYHKWLGIHPKDQPPNHYRLLALDLFESDRDAISNAADQRMMLVRSFQTGDRSRLSQRILNELAAAKICLLDARRKSDYDRQLRQQLSRTPLLSTASPPRPRRSLPAKSARGMGTASSSTHSDNNRHASVRAGWLAPLIVSAIGLFAATVMASVFLYFGKETTAGAVSAVPGQLQLEVRLPSVRSRAPNDVVTTSAPPSSPLQLRAVGPQRVAADMPLRIQVEVDERGRLSKHLRFFLGPNSPPGAVIHPESGVFIWPPSETRTAGSYSVPIIAVEADRRAEMNIDIVVESPLRPLSIRSIATQSVAVNSEFHVKLSTENDPNRAPFRYSILSGPEGATLDPSSGEFCWKPSPNNGGKQFEVKVQVADFLGRRAATAFKVDVVGVAAAGVPAKSDRVVEAKSTRLAIPSPGDRQKALAEVRRLFTEQYTKARRSVAERQKFADQLIAEGDTTTDDAAGRYVLYQEAMELARASGNVNLTMKAIDAIASHYDVDALEQKQQILMELAKNTHSEIEARELTQALLALVNDCIKRDNWEQAVLLVRSAGITASKTRNSELRKHVAQSFREVTALKTSYEDYQEAAKTLAMNASDPAANRIVGLYIAVIKGEWEQGLAALAKGDDAGLAAVAGQELLPPDSPDARKDVADAWAKVAAGTTVGAPAKKLLDVSGTARENIRNHALHWYQAAVKDLTGLKKRSVERQIVSLSTSAATNGSGIAGFARTIDDSSATYVGRWLTWSGSGCFNSNEHYITAVSGGTATATWHFTGLSPGHYNVYATWLKNQNQVTNAPYTIRASSPQVVLVNQKPAPTADATDGGQSFQKLATVAITENTLTISLSNNANGGTYVIADAVRIQRAP